MNEIEQVIRKLADASAYRPSRNPSATDRVVSRVERGCMLVFGSGAVVFACLVAAEVSVGPGIRGWVKAGAVLDAALVIVAGLAHAFADVAIRAARHAHRADDEYHHSAARALHRDPQVDALATHDDGVLEDMEDQLDAKLTGTSSRLSTLLGDRAAIVTTGVALLAAYKLTTDLKWVPSGPSGSMCFLAAGILLTLTPVIMRGLSERLIYQRELLASARKRKARANRDGGPVAVVETASPPAPAIHAGMRNSGDGFCRPSHRHRG